MLGLNSTGQRLLLALVLSSIGGSRAGLRAAEIDLANAVVVVPDGLSGTEAKAVRLLVEEVRRRSRIGWNTMIRWPTKRVPVIAVGPAAMLESLPSQYGQLVRSQPPGKAEEGFRIQTVVSADAAPVVSIVGNDARGVLFGVGRLLRELRMAPGQVLLPEALNLASAPKYRIRGHQLGYRPKTNSYDAWDLAQWDRYIRELAIFGTNAIELIPPRSDDAADSPHFPLPPLEMMAGMSQICDDYGMDVWIWYPAMDPDYADPKTVEHALAEWAEVFKKLPRIDAVFVPGGDPGHTRPKFLMDLLEKQAENLQALSSQSRDLDVAAKLYSRMVRRISLAHESRAGLARRRRVRSAGAQ